MDIHYHLRGGWIQIVIGFILKMLNIRLKLKKIFLKAKGIWYRNDKKERYITNSMLIQETMVNLRVFYIGMDFDLQICKFTSLKLILLYYMYVYTLVWDII